MSNPKFYAGELDVVTFTMSATEDASFPLSNLNNYVPADVWKSSSTGNNQTLKIDLGSALARDCIILENHNCDSNSDAVILQTDAADSPAFGSPETVATLSELGNGRIKVGGFTKTKRYWRIHFGTGLSAVPYIGNVFIAKEVDAGQTYVYPYSGQNETTPSVVRRSVSGLARSTRVFAGIVKFRITFDVVSDTFRTAWLRFHQKVIGRTPFYFYDCDDVGWYVFFTDEIDLETFNYQMHRTTELNMETQSVGQNPL
jgi:hypothetical protein